MNTITPIMLPAGYIDWVHPWRYDEGQPCYLYGPDFGAPYCPVNFEPTTIRVITNENLHP